ncbi:MAG TPA: protealysin inhibitor emfourin, partial [Candidatus Methylomirabilis sp.]|nr:protealysin inhibitor emfourin [Candidatus Methylomirabilis sp.]
SSDELLPDEEKRMRDLVESAHFFELPTVLRSPTPGADRFQYKISVETEQFKHTIQFDEGATPAQLRPLLAWLKQAAHKE